MSDFVSFPGFPPIKPAISKGKVSQVRAKESPSMAAILAALKKNMP
jgi:hypothetical protein